MDNETLEIKKEEKSGSKLLLNIILVISVFLIFSYYTFSSPNRNKDVTIHISSSDSLSKISDKLESEKVVRHSFPLKVLVYVLSGDKHISSGDYLFKKDKNMFKVSWQLSRGIHDINQIKITFKEGATREEMAQILSDKIPAFRKDIFLSDPRSKEGYLFPDTYFFFPMSTTDEILNTISSNFNKRISSLEKQIKVSGRSQSDIIIMASLIEKEANGKQDAATISGILWKRIKINMPLQVDAAKITYKEVGLPDSPICNPGLSSILAAIEPKDSPYLFYLHDNYGNVHFALDFSEHRSNIAHYLK